MDEHSGEDADLTLVEAAVHLGMSPVALAELLDRGTLASYLAADGRHRRIRLIDLEAHREKRFALRQELAQQARERRRPSYGPESTTADVVIIAS